METEQKAKEILDYVLNSLDIKRFIYPGQGKEMLKEIVFLIETS
jgi:hypothetical protein